MDVVRLIGYWCAPAFEVWSTPWPGSTTLGPPLSTQQLREAWEDHRASAAKWPDPSRFVDLDWDPEQRAVVADHLSRGAILVRYRGLAACRFCGRPNGSAEVTDGTYFWPEGLAHYLREHDVRLPNEFVEQALASLPLFPETPMPEFDDLGQRERDWSDGAADSVASLGMTVHVGPPPERVPAAVDWVSVHNPGRVSFEERSWVEVDASWWLAQQRL